jgi:hypothetical protein
VRVLLFHMMKKLAVLAVCCVAHAPSRSSIGGVQSQLGSAGFGKCCHTWEAPGGLLLLVG